MVAFSQQISIDHFPCVRDPERWWHTEVNELSALTELTVKMGRQILINCHTKKCTVRNRGNYEGVPFSAARRLRNPPWLGVKEALPAHLCQDVGCSKRSPASCSENPPGHRPPGCTCAPYSPCLLSVSVFGITHCTGPSWHHQVDKVKQD